MYVQILGKCNTVPLWTSHGPHHNMVLELGADFPCSKSHQRHSYWSNNASYKSTLLYLSTDWVQEATLCPIPVTTTGIDHIRPLVIALLHSSLQHDIYPLPHHHLLYLCQHFYHSSICTPEKVTSLITTKAKILFSAPYVFLKEKQFNYTIASTQFVTAK